MSSRKAIGGSGRLAIEGEPGSKDESGALATRDKAADLITKEKRREERKERDRKKDDHKHRADDDKGTNQKALEGGSSKLALEFGSQKNEAAGALVAKAKVGELVGKDKHKDEKRWKERREHDKKSHGHHGGDKRQKALQSGFDRLAIDYNGEDEEPSASDSGSLVTREKAGKLASKGRREDGRSDKHTASKNADAAYDIRGLHRPKALEIGSSSGPKSLQFPGMANDPDARALVKKKGDSDVTLRGKPSASAQDKPSKTPSFKTTSKSEESSSRKAKAIEHSGDSNKPKAIEPSPAQTNTMSGALANPGKSEKASTPSKSRTSEKPVNVERPGPKPIELAVSKVETTSSSLVTGSRTQELKRADKEERSATSSKAKEPMKPEKHGHSDSRAIEPAPSRAETTSGSLVTRDRAGELQRAGKAEKPSRANKSTEVERGDPGRQAIEPASSAPSKVENSSGVLVTRARAEEVKRAEKEEKKSSHSSKPHILDQGCPERDDRKARAIEPAPSSMKENKQIEPAIEAPSTHSHRVPSPIPEFLRSPSPSPPPSPEPQRRLHSPIPSSDNYSEPSGYEERTVARPMHTSQSKDKGKSKAIVRASSPSPSPSPSEEDYASHSSDDGEMRKWRRDMRKWKSATAEWEKSKADTEDEGKALVRKEKKEKGKKGRERRDASESESEVDRKGRELARKRNGEVARRRKVESSDSETSDDSAVFELMRKKEKRRARKNREKKEPVSMNINLSNTNNVTF